MVDQEKAERLLTTLTDALADLGRYRQTVDEARLTTDRDAQNMVLFALYVASQSAIDLAFHMAASKRLPRPSAYRDVFPALAAAGLLEPELAQRLGGWAGLRNILAHFYPVIDFRRVGAALRDDLPDLEAFALVAADWLAGA